MYTVFQWLLSLTCLAALSHATSYREHLTLHPLPQSALLAAFDFSSNISIVEFDQQNYNLFPRSLGQILLHAHTEELHLRFAFGRWDAETWGARPRGGRREGGTGVELWAWVRADNEAVAESRWFTLTNALSGLFCASLNFVDRTKTIWPASTFDREGNAPAGDLHLLHGALPHEVVCTENLTPFLKLMPCKGKAGISSLLDGHKLFDASWQSMAIDVRKTCVAGTTDCQIEIEQTVDMVLDIDRSMRPTKDPIPRPPPIESIVCNTTKSYSSHDTCFPADRTEERKWSLREIFGRPIRGSCPINESSADHAGEVELIVPAARVVVTEPKAKDVASKAQSATARIYKLPDGTDFDITLEGYPVDQDLNLRIPILSADRTFTGYGQERGGVHSVLTNLSPAPLDVVYLESLPWFMKPYLHTLKATVSPFSASSNSSTSPITNILYRPAHDRERGTHLELSLQIPASSTLTLTYYFEKAILRYTEYPPDANRGFDVAPAVIRILPRTVNQIHPHLGRRSGGKPVHVDGEERSTYMRTTSLLLPLPTPDFSMPYNVIILTSTVIAMGFGSIFNLLTRRFVAADEVDGPALGGLLRARVQGVVARVKERFASRKAKKYGTGSKPGIRERPGISGGMRDENTAKTASGIGIASGSDVKPNGGTANGRTTRSSKSLE